MEEYKPNSHKYKEEQSATIDKKIEKVISGTAKAKKKSGMLKFAENFIQEDASSIKDFVIKDVVVPLVKKGIDDTVHMLLYGESSGRKNTPASGVSYQPYYSQSNNRRNYTSPVVARNAYNFDDIVLDNCGDAELVLTQMEALIGRYEFVSVADLYDLVGMKCNYTDNKYGWTDLRGSEIVRLRDGGYTLRLPKVVPLN